MVYFEATANGDTLSQEGGLHAARKKKGNTNGPGPQLADAAGGRRYEPAGGRHLWSCLQAEDGKTRCQHLLLSIRSATHFRRAGRSIMLPLRRSSFHNYVVNMLL